MRGKALALLLLLGLAAFVAPSRAETVEDDDEYSDVDATAFLLVRRKLSDDKPQIGKVSTVLVEIHNAGKSDASSVSVKEEAWRPDAFLTEGQLEAEFDTIPAGTTQSFSYSITPKDSGASTHTVAPVLVTYIAEANTKPVTTHSSALTLQVFSSTDLFKEKALDWGSTLSLGMLVTESDWIRFGVLAAAGVLAYMLLGFYKVVSKSHEDSKRRKALKGLGLEDLK